MTSICKSVFKNVRDQAWRSMSQGIKESRKQDFKSHLKKPPEKTKEPLFNIESIYCLYFLLYLVHSTLLH